MTCPKCGADLSLNVEAVLAKETILTMRLNGAPGTKLQIATWGSMMTNLDKALKESARMLGGKVVPMLHAVRTIDDGLEIDIMLASSAKGNSK